MSTQTRSRSARHINSCSVAAGEKAAKEGNPRQQSREGSVRRGSVRRVPSITHEALLMLFRNRPELAPELLRDALHVPLPAYADVRVESADLAEVAPAEYRADLVVHLIDGKPVLGIVVEVQLQQDRRKRFTWPVYVANLRARLECDTCVLVVTPSESVATWAREPVELGPGSTFEPFVIGPSAVPIIDDAAAAGRDPELVVLSAMAHGKEEAGASVALAALAALAASTALDDDRRLLYWDLVLLSLSEAARAALEELMAGGNYEYQSDFAKTHRAQGRVEGRVEGRAAGEAVAILTFLDARGIVVTDEHKKRILACSDLDILERWIRKAVSVTTADELFVD